MELLQAADTGEHDVTHPGLVGTGDVDHKVVWFGNGLTLKICTLFTNSLIFLPQKLIICSGVEDL